MVVIETPGFWAQAFDFSHVVIIISFIRGNNRIDAVVFLYWSDLVGLFDYASSDHLRKPTDLDEYLYLNLV